MTRIYEKDTDFINIYDVYVMIMGIKLLTHKWVGGPCKGADFEELEENYRHKYCKC